MHTMRRFTILTVYIHMVYHLLGIRLRLLAPRRRPLSIVLAAPQLRPVQGIHSIGTTDMGSADCPYISADTLMHTRASVLYMFR